MNYRFPANQISRISTVAPYIVLETNGSEIVIETSGNGWTVRQLKLSRNNTVLVEPPRNSAQGPLQKGRDCLWHGNVVELDYQGETVYCLQPVRIYRPELHHLEIGTP